MGRGGGGGSFDVHIKMHEAGIHLLHPGHGVDGAGAVCAGFASKSGASHKVGPQQGPQCASFQQWYMAMIGAECDAM